MSRNRQALCCTLFMTLAACSADGAQPTGPDGESAPATASVTAAATTEEPEQLSLSDSCAEVAKAFGFQPPLNAHIRRYGFPEKVDGNAFPIFEGTAAENAKAIDAALVSYEKLVPQLHPEIKKDADAFAAVARQRVKNIGGYQKTRAEQATNAKDPKAQALADGACFGMMAMVNDKCPEAVFGKEVKEMGAAADALEARCAGKPAP